MKRAAIYIRVSTEEQAKAGFSLPEQRHKLIEYCDKQGYEVVDIYADEGVSAYKDPIKRTEFQRMLNDVRTGKIDIIVFVKLDRWFRNVKHYYLTQDILDKHNVTWKCTEEEYDLNTRTGNLHLIIRLGVGEDETRADSERVKFVFNGKVRNGEAITGMQPYGYKIAEDKTIVKDPDAEAYVQDMFDYYLQCFSGYDTHKYLEEKYGVTVDYQATCRRLKNPAYTGEYRDNPTYRPAYITKEQHLQIIKQFALRTRKPQGDKTYLFSGLIKCPVCGSTLVSCTLNKKHQCYRCKKHNNKQGCDYSKSIREDYIETILLNEMQKIMKDIPVQVKAAKTRKEKKPDVSPAVYEGRLKRLNDIYIAGNIDQEEYNKKAAELKLKIAESSKPKKQATTIPPDLQEILSMDRFEALYGHMDAKGKKVFWRKIINQIDVNADGRIVSINYSPNGTSEWLCILENIK